MTLKPGTPVVYLRQINHPDHSRRFAVDVPTYVMRDLGERVSIRMEPKDKPTLFKIVKREYLQTKEQQS